MRRKYHPNGIKHHRRSMDPIWSQKELAERVGCNQSDISAYEKGKVMPSLAIALRIARAFGRVIEEVFFGLTAAVYGELGPRQPAPVDDDDDTEPGA